MKMHRLLPLIAAALVLASSSHAQTGKVYRIGFLSPGDFAPGTNPGRLTEEISRQLAQSGFTTGANLELIKRGAEGHFERLPALVTELVAAKVDVIVTFSYPVAAGREGRHEPDPHRDLRGRRSGKDASRREPQPTGWQRHRHFRRSRRARAKAP